MNLRKFLITSVCFMFLFPSCKIDNAVLENVNEESVANVGSIVSEVSDLLSVTDSIPASDAAPTDTTKVCPHQLEGFTYLFTDEGNKYYQCDAGKYFINPQLGDEGTEVSPEVFQQVKDSLDIN